MAQQQTRIKVHALIMCQITVCCEAQEIAWSLGSMPKGTSYPFLGSRLCLGTVSFTSVSGCLAGEEPKAVTHTLGQKENKAC